MEETRYQIDLNGVALKQIYKSICFHLDQWPGGDPFEQQLLDVLRTEFCKLVLEETFQSDAWRLTMERGLGTSEIHHA
jgi:hypothetical protein